MEQKKTNDPYPKSSKICHVYLEENLFDRFWKIAKDQNISLSRLATQFIKNYVYFMDDEFLDSDEQYSSYEGAKIVTVYFPNEIFIKFKEKSQKANISFSRFLREMISRYVEFVEKIG